MKKHAIINYTQTAMTAALPIERISSFLKSLSDRRMSEARAAVHAYESAIRSLDDGSPAPQTTYAPADKLSLYGKYLKDTNDSL
jgi:hypothetical protein